MNSLAHSFQQVTEVLARAAEPVKRISVSQALQDFAGIDAAPRQALGRVANAMQAAVHGGTAYAANVTEADFRVLEDFTDFLRGDFELVGVARRDTAPDQQHSPDESHFLDRERL
jgi:hypothetical protein